MKAGRIRHLGISIGKNDDVDQTSRARDVGAEVIQVVYNRHDPATVQRKLAEAERSRREEVPAGLDLATWALARCLQHPAVSCVIPGCKSAAHP